MNSKIHMEVKYLQRQLIPFGSIGNIRDCKRGQYQFSCTLIARQYAVVNGPDQSQIMHCTILLIVLKRTGVTLCDQLTPMCNLQTQELYQKKYAQAGFLEAPW